MDSLGYKIKNQISTPMGMKPRNERTENDYSHIDAAFGTPESECCADTDTLCAECQIFADVNAGFGIEQ